MKNIISQGVYFDDVFTFMMGVNSTFKQKYMTIFIDDIKNPTWSKINAITYHFKIRMIINEEYN